MQFEWTITFGSLIQFVIFLGTVVVTLLRVERGLSRAMDVAATNIVTLQNEVTKLQGEIKQLAAVVVELAKQEVRVGNLEQMSMRRFDRLERQFDDLARGEGFKLPLFKPHDT